MSNFGPPGGSPDPWDDRPGDGYGYGPPDGDQGYGPRYDQGGDPRYDTGYGVGPGGWGDPPTRHREAAGPYREPPIGHQQSAGPYREQPIGRYEPDAGWGQPADPPGRLATDPGYGGQAYPGPTPPKRGRGPLRAVLAVLVVLVLGGAAAFWFLGRDEPARVAGPPAAEPTAGASEPAAPSATAPAPASSTDPRFVRAGQCVRNEGASGQPKLVISECGAKTYQVLRRVDGATSGKKDAQAKCAKVAGYTDWYFFDSDLDTLDFVLCLKQR